jgi:tol-pal system protein YbgF
MPLLMRKISTIVASLVLISQGFGVSNTMAQMPVPPLDLPVVKQSLIIPVQAADPRVGQLEEQLRTMNGRVEELNFLVLELQEMLRKQQKDNEFRFQELEGGKGGAAPQQNGDAGGAIAPVEPQTGVATATDTAVEPSLGAPEQNLGTLTADQNGNPAGGNAGGDAVAGIANPGDIISGQAIPAGLGDGELFEASYNLVLAGDYAAAESALKEHVSRFPKSKRASDAKYWLGESQLGQDKYADAAENFLAISRNYPKSERAPEALLKLGISMAALKKNDIACATFSEVIKRYPNADEALKSRIDTEKAAAQC